MKGKDISILGTIVFDIFVTNHVNYPRLGEAVSIDRFHYLTGGCGANSAIVLRKMGINVSLIGAVGDDFAGDFILNYLKQNFVDIKLIKKSNKFPTSSSILLINKSGERSYFHSVGASKEISITEKEIKEITKSKIFHIGGVNLLPSLGGNKIAALLKKVKSYNVITSVDLAWDVEGKWMERIETALPFIDILMGNKKEIQALTGSKGISCAVKKLHQKGCKIVVIKAGESGSFVSKEDFLIKVDGTKVKVKDSTGAGDAFAAGLLYGILNGFSLVDSAKIANSLGAIAVTEIGSTSAFNSKEQIFQFVCKNYDLAL